MENATRRALTNYVTPKYLGGKCNNCENRQQELNCYKSDIFSSSKIDTKHYKNFALCNECFDKCNKGNEKQVLHKWPLQN